MRLAYKKDSVTSALVIPDLHVPKHDRAALRIVEAAMRERRFDYAIYLGDVLDLESISKYSKADLRKFEPRGVLREFSALEDVMGRHVELLGPQCQIVWIQGNHEYRLERVIHAMPPLEGILDIERNISFVRDGRVKFVRFYETGEGVYLGDCLFIHGIYHSEYHAKRHATLYPTTNIVYGHTHDVDSYSRPTRDRKVNSAQSLGCLCRMDLEYMALKACDWQHAYAIYHFDTTGKSFPYVHLIKNGKLISPDGRLVVPHERDVARKALERR